MRTTLTFDITPGMPGAKAPEFSISKELLKRLVAQSGVMFVSHMHFRWLKHLSTEFRVEQRTDR